MEMEVHTRPAIFGTAMDGWRYAFAAVSRMPAVLGVGLLAITAIAILTLSLPLPTGRTVPAQIADLVTSIVNGFFLTPVAIAVHRFVLLGEITDRYRLNPTEPRFQQFFIWTALYQLFTTVPGILLRLSGPDSNSSLFTMGVVLFVWAIIASLRLLILFPAIAVDAPGAAWQNAYEDTKGHTWRIFLIVALTAIPIFAMFVLLFLLAYFIPNWPDDADTVGKFLLAALQAVLQSVVAVLMLSAYAAVASLLYAVFKKRLSVAFSQPVRRPGG